MPDCLRLLPLGEACRRLRVCPDTVRAWFDAGRLRGMRSASGRRLILEEDVEARLRDVDDNRFPQEQ